jgi:outer membrane PBP1 activator LpoA protein
MLHVSPRRGQARRAQQGAAAAAVLALILAAPVMTRAESEPPTLAQAAAIAASGDHLAAAARYEQLARRGFMSWDTETALLAAREYAIGGALGDAERLAEKVRSRVRSDAERTLQLEVDARLALERRDPARALSALRALPSPLPAESAADLLALRGRAEIASGDALSGVRTFEERSAAVQNAAEFADNDRLLFEQLRLHPPGPVTQGGVSERERGWLELPAVVAAASESGGSAPSGSPVVQQWLSSHPGHPGAAFIPGAQSGAPGQALAASAGNAGSIALLLPLSGRQQAAGAAVRDGFTAAWFASTSGDARPRVDVFDTAVEGAAAAYQRALAGGARVVVGPLTKEDITAVLAAQPAGLPVPTLALNVVTTPGMSAPAFLFQFALDPEQEARAVARRIAADGLVRGVALFPDNAWGQRLHDAFTQELQSTGTVTLLSAQYYAPGAKDFSGPLRAALGRYGGAGDRSSNANQPQPARNAAAEQANGPQFAFVAATPQAARAIRPQLRFQMTYDLPLYTTSDAWDPSVRAAADMDGMVFPEMPWLLYGGQGAPELWDAVNDEWSARARGRLRLYAFGYDAFRLAQQFGSPGAIVAGVDGLTGLLQLNATDGRIQRDLQFARIEGGKPQVAGVGAPMNRDVLPANASGTTTPN